MSLENITLAVKSRTEKGKNESRRLRAAGQVPATIYGGHSDAVSAVVDKREFAALLRAHGRGKIITLDQDGVKNPVKIAALQLHPVRGHLVHADFMRISLTEKTNFDLMIHAVGEPEGVKTHGGILDHQMHQITIRCLPTVLPTSIDIDVTALGIGDHVCVKDLKLADGIEVLADPDALIFTVVAPRVEEETPAASTDTAAEPEVIKKGKPEDK